MKAIARRWRRPIFNDSLKCSGRCCSSDVSGSGYKQKAVYPPISDLSEDAVDRRKRQELFDKYRDIRTVEEKLFAFNLPKYYGWKSLMLKEGCYPYNCLPFVKHITRTRHLRGTTDLLYRVLGDSRKDECKELLRRIRPQIQEAVLFELKGRRWQNEKGIDDVKSRDCDLQDTVGKNVARQINNIVVSALSSGETHLLNATVDYEPRVEGFWAVGGFFPSQAEIEARTDKKKDIQEEEKNKVLEHWIQYIGSPALQVRVKLPLKVLDTEHLEPADFLVSQGTTGTSTEDCSDRDALIKPYCYDPSDTFGLTFERRFGTNIAGFWPGDENEFGLLSYHLCGHLLDRPPHFGPDETFDTLAVQAILSSYSWLHAQATYQGFSTFHELSYPLVNQCIVTDGHHFSYHVYQLNTVLLHSNHTVTNPRTNVCLSLPHRPLYQHIQNNQFVGWNDEVLEALLLLYLNKPEERKGVNMKPNLNDEIKHLADMDDGQRERRIWLHRQFRHMYSNRPRHRLPYEIYDWERIYKIKFETRPMEARLRPFELDCNPLEDRKYYQHMHEYIPKAQRPKKKHWTGWRAKFAKTFYPNIEF